MRVRRIASLLFILALWLPATGPAQEGGSPSAETATQTGGGTASVSLEQLKKLRGTLDDPQQRQALMDQLDALIAVRQSQGENQETSGAKPEGLAAWASRRVEGMAGQIGEFAVTVARLPALLEATWRQASDPRELLRWATEAGHVLVLILLAIGGGGLTAYLTRRASQVVVAMAMSSWLFSVLAYLLHFTLALLPTAVFLGIAYLVLPAAGMAETTRTLCVILVNALAAVHAISIAGRELFNPPSELAAPFRLGEESGAYVALWLRRFAVVGVYGFFVSDALGTFGVSSATVGILERVVGLLLAGMAIVLVMQSRKRVGEWIRRDAKPASLRVKLSHTWHYLALLCIVTVTAVGMLGDADSFSEVTRGVGVSLVVIFVAAMFSQGVDALLKRVFTLSQELKDRHPRLEDRANRYLPVLRKVLRGLVYVLGFLGLLQAWGLGGIEWLSSDTGLTLGSSVLSIALTLLGAMIVWEVVTALVEDALTRASPDLDAAAMQRRQTLLPLAKNAIRLTLIVLVVLVAFSELGINIAPLLAGAGVIGLAIGFGAQSLVQDLITGVFILLEDSVAVGDFVEVAGFAGTVESLSIRSIRLRDIEGNVHTVPFSQVDTVHNMTDKFAYALVDVGVAYRENVDDVCALLEEVGEALKEDETWGKDILDGIEIWGLNALSDSSVDIRVRFKTVAGRQWAVRREFLRRVKAAFDEREIEIPFPHRTLYFGVDKQGEAPPARLLVDQSAPSPDDDPGTVADGSARGAGKGELGDAQEGS